MIGKAISFGAVNVANWLLPDNGTTANDAGDRTI
jgi:hypothetical protein